MWMRKRKERQETGEAGAEARTRIAPIDVQQRVFRLAFRGYNEQDVDRFLDEVTEELAHLHEDNKRLRERLEAGGTGGGVAEAERRAEEIVRQAREHAARLMEEAESAGGPGPSRAHLVREREFLTRLASLVQDHAEWLRRHARAAPREEEAGSETKGAGRPIPEEPSAEDDWDNPFVTPSPEAAATPSPPGGGPVEGTEEDSEDPSLRQLFWGEE